MDKKQRIKKILYIPLYLLLLSLVGYLLLVLAYCIPTSSMEKNIRQSAEFIQREGKQSMLTNKENSKLDSYTDALMLLTAGFESEETPWIASLLSEREWNETDTTEDILYQRYVENKAFESVGYARYWHGYLVVLKPLLTVMNYPNIRYVLMTIQMGLFAYMIYLCGQRKNQLIFSIVILWLYWNPVTTMLSLQFHSMVTVTWLAIIAVFLLERRKDMNLYRWGMLFLTVGAMTSYVDLLTYPIVSLGIPLIVWLSLQEKKLAVEVRACIQLSAFWGVGYAGMWGMKWLLASVITGKNVLAEAINQVELRSGAEVVDAGTVSGVQIILRQIGAGLTPVMILCGICLVFMVFYKTVKNKLSWWRMILPYAIVGSYPIVWYMVLKNHSYLHFWYTYRDMGVSLFAISEFLLRENRKTNKGE